MKNEYLEAAFFSLIKAGLWEKEVRLQPFGDIDFSEVLQLAEEQSVVGLVAAGIERVVDYKPQKIDVLQFIGRTVQLEQRNQAMNYFIEVIVEKMREAGIFTLLVKGQGISQCYERPLWRASGDVDFLLDAENYEKAKAFLLPLATSSEHESNAAKHFGITIDPWVVELHGTLHTGLSQRIDNAIDQIQIDSIERGSVRVWRNENVDVFLPKPDNDVVFIFTHFLKHFYKGGIGLRQVCDWCRLLWTYKDAIDLPLLKRRFESMRLMSEWKAFGTFAVESLGMPSFAMPFYSPDAKWRRKADRIQAFILEVGNFGHNRDHSYFEKYPFLIRKVISFGRRVGDLFRHARIFPMDSLRFFPNLFINGVRSAAKGEG